MTADELQQLVAREWIDGLVTVQGGDGRFSLLVVSDDFEGLSEVKRQQKVYASIQSYISSGEIHAVNIRSLTQAQHQEKQAE